jgi:tRNA dimethylallyltransferase
MTATASFQEREGVPHHLLSFLSPTETEFNVNLFVNRANEVLKDLEDRKVQNIIVGGTNYYTESLIYSNDSDKKL